MIDESVIGRTFAPVFARVEQGRLRAFLDVLSERSPLYRDRRVAVSAGYADLPIPSTYLFCLEMMDAERPFEFLDELGIDIARILHGEQSFTYHAAVCVGDALTFISSIKSVTTKKGGAMQFETADVCLKLHGGYGYMKEYAIARRFVDARVQMIYGGTNEIMKVLIARSL